MSSHLFYNGQILSTAGAMRGWVLVEDARIAQVGAGGPPVGIANRTDLAGRLLAPGLIDIHTHGALGHDAMDADPQALRKIAGHCAQHGVTAFLATTMTAPQADIMAAMAAIQTVMQEGSGGAQLLGAHVEGPYLNRDKRGAQVGDQIRPALVAEYEPLLATGVVRLVTVAPEYPENQAFITAAAARGVALSAGHTTATYEQMRAATLLGLSQVTHLFNGMEALHHRTPGAVGAALTLDSLYCQLIADNIHVHPAVLRLVLKAKGIGRVILITDAMRGAGMPDGDYELGGQHVIVQNGECRLENGSLAGSTLTLDRAVRNMMQAGDLSLVEALTMATSTPAAALGLDSKGSIAVGKDADLIVLEAGAQVALTMVGGQIVYEK